MAESLFYQTLNMAGVEAMLESLRSEIVTRDEARKSQICAVEQQLDQVRNRYTCIS